MDTVPKSFVDELKSEWRGHFDPLQRQVDELDARLQKQHLDTRPAGPQVRGDILGAKHTLTGWAETKGLNPDGVSRDQFRLGAVIAAMVNPKARAGLSDTEEKAVNGSNLAEGGALLNPALAGFVLDDIRARTLVIQAGATTIPMTSPDVYIPRIKDGGGVEGTWRGEGAAVTEDAPVFERVGLHAKTLAVLVKVSYEAMEDMADAGRAAIERDIVNALSVAVDKAALVGTGVDGQPLGLVNHTGVSATSTDAAPTDYDKVIDLVATVRGQNHEPTAIFTSETEYATFGKLKTGIASDKTPLEMPKYLDGLPWYTTTSIPATLGANSDASYVIAGDFRSLYIGVRPEFGIRVYSSRDRYLDTMQVAILGWTRVDVAVGHPAAFAHDLLRD